MLALQTSVAGLHDQIMDLKAKTAMLETAMEVKVDRAERIEMLTALNNRLDRLESRLESLERRRFNEP